MWLGRQGRAFRGWFAAETGDGTLRTGLTNVDVNVFVVNQADTAMLRPLVSQSLQRTGSYYFDVTSGFLLANGTGSYAVTVMVDTTVTGGSGVPQLVDVIDDVLIVSKEDLDTLGGTLTVVSSSVAAVSGALQLVSGSVDFVRHIEGGRWRVNTASNRMEFYQADNQTLVAQFDLFDAAGASVFESPFERRRV